MCFKNLPIEFDAEGNARLKEGVADPRALRRAPDPYAELRQLAPDAARSRGGTERAVTHVAGAHAFHSLVVHGGGRR